MIRTPSRGRVRALPLPVLVTLAGLATTSLAGAQQLYFEDVPTAFDGQGCGGEGCWTVFRAACANSASLFPSPRGGEVAQPGPAGACAREGTTPHADCGLAALRILSPLGEGKVMQINRTLP